MDEEFDDLDPPLWGSQEEQSIAKVEAEYQATQAHVAPTQGARSPSTSRNHDTFDTGFEPVSKKIKLDAAAKQQQQQQQQGRRSLPVADEESQDRLPHMRIEGDRYVVSHAGTSAGAAASTSAAAAAAARRSPSRPQARLGPGRPMSAAPPHFGSSRPSHPAPLLPNAPAPPPDDFRITHRGGPPRGIGIAHSRTLANAHADEMDDGVDDDGADAMWDTDELDRAEEEAVRSASQQTQPPPPAVNGARRGAAPGLGRAGPDVKVPQRTFARSVSGPAVGLGAGGSSLEAQKRALGRQAESAGKAGSALAVVDEAASGGGAQQTAGRSNDKEKALAQEVARLRSQLDQLQNQNQELNKKVLESVKAAQAKAGEVAIVRAEAKRASAQAASQAKENSTIKQRHEEQLKMLKDEHQQELSRVESSALFEHTALSTSAHASRWSVLHSSARRRAAPPSVMRRGDGYSQSHSQAAAASLGITTPTKRGRSRATELGVWGSEVRGQSMARATEDEDSPSRRGSVKRDMQGQKGRGSDSKPNRLAFNSFVDDEGPLAMIAPPPHRRGKSVVSVGPPPSDFADDGCLPDMDMELQQQVDKSVDAAAPDDGQGATPPLYLWAMSTYMRKRKTLVAMVLAHHSPPLGAGSGDGKHSRLVVRHGADKSEAGSAATSRSLSTLHRILNADVSSWGVSLPMTEQVQAEEERRYLDAVSMLLNALTASAADDAELRFADLADAAVMAAEVRRADEERARTVRADFKWDAAQRMNDGVDVVLEEIAVALRCLLGVFVRVADYARLHDVMRLMTHLCVAHPSFVFPLLESDVVAASTMNGLTQLSLGGGDGEGEDLGAETAASLPSGQVRPSSTSNTTALRRSTDVIRLAHTLTTRLVEAMHNAKALVSPVAVGATSGNAGGVGQLQPLATGAPTLLLAPTSTSARPVAIPIASGARGTMMAAPRGAAVAEAGVESEDGKGASRSHATDLYGPNKGLDEVLDTLVDLLDVVTAEVKEQGVQVFGALLGQGSALYTLLDSKRPPLLCARVIGVLTTLASHDSLWKLVLASEPDVNSSVVLRRPAALRMLDLIASRMVPRQGQHLTDEYHLLHRSAAIFLTQLAIAHDDAARILAESPPVLAALVKCLHLDTSLIWSLDGQGVRSEGDEGGRGTKRGGSAKLNALIERITTDLRLLHFLFTPSRSDEAASQPNKGPVVVGDDDDDESQRKRGPTHAPSSRRPAVDLATRLAKHETSILFNGVRHAFALALSRIAWADEPEWVDSDNVKRLEGVNDLALELLELVLSPDEIEEAWSMYEPDEEEEEEEEQGYLDDERRRTARASGAMGMNETDSQTQMEEDEN